MNTSKVIVDPILGLSVPAVNAPQKPKFGKRDAKAAFYHLAIWIPLTAFIIALIIKGKGKPGYEFAIVVYVLITLRLLAKHVSMSQLVYDPLERGWNATVGTAFRSIPATFRVPLGLVAYLAVMIGVACGTPASETGTIPQRLQSIGGVIVMTAILVAFSRDRKNIPWGTVVVGFWLQFLMALFILKTQLGVDIFYFISQLITTFLGESNAGLEFVLGSTATNPFKNTFVVSVLPAILFFVAFISIIYYIGGMQYVVEKFAWVMVRLMNTSGAESVVAAASPFVGQGESALLVKPFIEFMTRSELHSAMVSGFSTIAGSVLIAYINYTGNNPTSTSTLLASCLMSVPCSLMVSKIIYPEVEESITKGTVTVPEAEEKDANLLDAASKGAAIGVQLCLLITGSLLAIISLYACANDLVGWAFNMISVSNWIDASQPVSIQLLLSYIFWPIAVCVGIPVGDARKSAEFMATKVVVNEFVAYANLHDYAFLANATADGSYVSNGAFGLRTIRLLAFALCGFANIGSIGIQTSILGHIAPSRKRDLAELALSAMLTGAFSTWISAAVAGAIL